MLPDGSSDDEEHWLAEGIAGPPTSAPPTGSSSPRRPTTNATARWSPPPGGRSSPSRTRPPRPVDPTRAPCCSLSPTRPASAFAPSSSSPPAATPARPSQSFHRARRHAVIDADARNAAGQQPHRALRCRFDHRQAAALFGQYNHANPNRDGREPVTCTSAAVAAGLPLDKAGEVGTEEFYTEVYGGGQFIQQGMCNGLTDVDVVFYLTRKSLEMESFNVHFDADAPKVALPQGVMAPVNSLNTMFHAPAFWGLALPVSVSPMASDVIRGYWAQRILWEIGGQLVVYPPMHHRPIMCTLIHSMMRRISMSM
ncbi:hypothetical protein ZWY2020_008096 [Hordeum vulgare]|nr:hypothetical protein ZWY2020_008096 [Hordeum vulgare]